LTSPKFVTTTASNYRYYSSEPSIEKMSYFHQFTFELHNLLTGVLYRRSPTSQLT